MAKKMNFKNAIGEMIDKSEEKVVKQTIDEGIVDTLETPFVLEKKQKTKSIKKTFPVYMDEEKVNQLDKICNETGYTRNELINMMVEKCLKNIQLK